jgi:hypothetical protein
MGHAKKIGTSKKLQKILKLFGIKGIKIMGGTKSYFDNWLLFRLHWKVSLRLPAGECKLT